VPVEESDLIIRMVVKFSQMAARVLRLRRSGQVVAAIEEVQAAQASIVQVDPRLVDLVDATTLADRIGHPETIDFAAQLQAMEAELRADAGEAELAARRWRSALELSLEAILRGGKDPATADRARALAARTGGEGLAPRHRDALRALSGG
jgi:hypothetical protein